MRTRRPQLELELPVAYGWGGAREGAGRKAESWLLRVRGVVAREPVAAYAAAA